MNEQRIETITQTFICLTELEQKQKTRFSRVDKYYHPIIKGVKGKKITFKDEIEGTDLCQIYEVQKYIKKNDENSSKCSCTCCIQ